jgi:hypothetical protein
MLGDRLWISDICAARPVSGRLGVAPLLELGRYASAEHARGSEDDDVHLGHSGGVGI